MVTETIVPSLPDITKVRADSYDVLAGYETFRRIQDDFEEPPRPSLDDVESVAAVLRDSLASSFGQDSAEFVDSEPLTGEWAERNKLTDASQIAHGSHEGRTHQLILSPGTLRLTSFDARARAATEERALQARSKRGGGLARFCALAECPLFELVPAASEGSGSEVVEWSAKSRARMVETLAALDYSTWLSCGGTLAMLTLTLPGNWEVLVPSGAIFKGYVRKFEQRWRRARSAPLVRTDALDALGSVVSGWSADPSTRLEWRCLWKLEFQGAGRLRTGEVRAAGAPHWHGLIRLPVFVYSSGGYNSKLGYEVQEMVHDYVSRTWADVVGASDVVDGKDKWGKDTSEYLRHLAAGTGIDFSGKDFSDPRRISMYFLGHSAKSSGAEGGKEYQHKVPKLWRAAGKGPGRFWGYCGLGKAMARVTVTYEDLVRLKRIARKVKGARDWRVNVLREQGKAMKSGAAVPSAFDVQQKTRGRGPVKGEIAVRRGARVPDHLTPLYADVGNGRSAHSRRNREAFAAHQLGYTDIPVAASVPFLVEGPVWRVPNLVSVPPAVGIGPSNLVQRPWVPQKRSAYAPFSNGQGGFVLVNDGLQLGLDIARAAGPAAPPLVALYRRVAASDPVRARRLIAARLP